MKLLKAAVLTLLVSALLISALLGCATRGAAPTRVSGAGPQDASHNAGGGVFTPPRSPALFVSPAGKDSWSGLYAEPTADGTDGPMATPQGARDVLRLMRVSGSLPVGAMTVSLRAGRYDLSQSLQFVASDSGSPSAEIIFESYPGEKPVISGGVVVDSFSPLQDAEALARIPASARPHVVQADLRGLGIDDLGSVDPATGNRLELYFRGRLMSRARYPNDGWLTIASVPQTGPTMLNPGLDRDTAPVPRGRHYGRFTYSGDRPKGWEPRKDIWVHGYWTWDWADQYLRVDRLDTATREVWPAPPHHAYGYTAGQRFAFLNVLEELDSPGEWYIDPGRGTLFFWPPQPLERGDLVISVMKEPLVSIEGGRGIVLRGLCLEAGRGSAVRIAGSTGCRVEQCLVRNVGQTAVVIDGGSDCQVTGCEIRDVGAGGISLSGGNRKTLEPSRHLALGNHIHDFAQCIRTGQPAIRLAGVGQRAAGNLIHEAPHLAVAITGNDHILEFNEVYHVAQETSDVGAFYMGRDWTERGIVIRWNYFHDLAGFGSNDVMAVYLDDMASGATLEGNLFVRAGCGVFIGGGRDNIVQHNVFVDCKLAVQIDARGLGWARPSTLRDGGLLYRKLDEVGYSSEPWASRYPALARILSSGDPAIPEGNVINFNLFHGRRWLDEDPAIPAGSIRVARTMITGGSDFVDAAHGDFRLRPDSPALAAGFPQVRLLDMGLPHGRSWVDR